MPSATILIVDDEQSILNGLARSLRHPEYTLLSATSPDAALQELKEHPVDVISSDHLMPGMTGLELLRLVRDRYPGTARITLTGHADVETAVKAINEEEDLPLSIQALLPRRTAGHSPPRVGAAQALLREQAPARNPPHSTSASRDIGEDRALPRASLGGHSPDR